MINASIILIITQYIVMVAPIPILSFTLGVSFSEAFLSVTRSLTYLSSLIVMLAASSTLFVIGFGRSDQAYSNLSGILAFQGTLTVFLYYLLCLIASGGIIEAVSLMFSGLASVIVPILQLLTSFTVNPKLRASFNLKMVIKRLLTLLPISTLPLYYFIAQIYGQNIYTNTFVLIYFLITVLALLKISK